MINKFEYFFFSSPEISFCLNAVYGGKTTSMYEDEAASTYGGENENETTSLIMKHKFDESYFMISIGCLRDLPRSRLIDAVSN